MSTAFVSGMFRGQLLNKVAGFDIANPLHTALVGAAAGGGLGLLRELGENKENRSYANPLMAALAGGGLGAAAPSIAKALDNGRAAPVTNTNTSAEAPEVNVIAPPAEAPEVNVTAPPVASSSAEPVTNNYNTHNTTVGKPGKGIAGQLTGTALGTAGTTAMHMRDYPRYLAELNAWENAWKREFGHHAQVSKNINSLKNPLRFLAGRVGGKPLSGNNIPLAVGAFIDLLRSQR